MDLEERRSLVASFLRKCVTYADDSINRKRDRGLRGRDREMGNYRDFTEHAVMEVSMASSTNGWKRNSGGNLVLYRSVQRG